MKRAISLIAFFVVFTLAGHLAAADLTPGDLLRAYRSGVSTATLKNLVEAADRCVTAKTDELVQLRNAGVPDEVIGLYQKCSGAPTPGERSSATAPDDQRLQDIVRLHQAGLDEELILAQIAEAQPPYDLTTSDLIYLKEHGVSERIIKALISSPQSIVGEVEPASGTEERPANTGILEFEPLLRFSKIGGIIPKKTDGRLLLVGGKIQWVDEGDPDLSFDIFDSVLKKVTLECEAANCFELRIKTVHGDKFRFRDRNWEVGGNTQIMALWETLKSRHAKVKFIRKD